MGAPATDRIAGLCTRCGLRGQHATSERCIVVLRERLACLELLMTGRYGDAMRLKRWAGSGRKPDARTRELLDVAQPAGAGVSGV
jgi:hypothetical protein